MIGFADIFLYILSISMYAYSKYSVQNQNIIKGGLFVIYATVFFLNLYGVRYESSQFLVPEIVEYSFHTFISMGICAVAMILLLMYRADKMPMYYYHTMMWIVVAVIYASMQNILSLIIGIGGIILVFYNIIIQIDIDKNFIKKSYKDSLRLSFISVCLGAGILLYISDFHIFYVDYAVLIQTNNQIGYYVATLLLCAGIMGIGGVLPFSTAVLNVHRLFDPPVVLINRLMVVTTLFLILGQFIISVYGVIGDTFWQFLFVCIGIMCMLVSILGSLLQKSISRLYGYVALGHIGFISIILSTEQLNAMHFALQYAIGYIFSYLAFWTFVRSIFVGRSALESITDLQVVRINKPYYTFWLCIVSLCFAGFPPLSLFWSKILVLHQPEYWGQSSFWVLVILVFVQGIWALRFMYFAYIYNADGKGRIVYTHNASSMVGMMRVILSLCAIFYVFI